jgi:hypothetical protein
MRRLWRLFHPAADTKEDVLGDVCPTAGLRRRASGSRDSLGVGDKLRLYGNAVVPAQAQLIANLIRAAS